VRGTNCVLAHDALPISYSARRRAAHHLALTAVPVPALRLPRAATAGHAQRRGMVCGLRTSLTLCIAGMRAGSSGGCNTSRFTTLFDKRRRNSAVPLKRAA